MSVDEFYKYLGVKHTQDCEICQDNKELESHFKASVQALWFEAWFVWACVIITAVVAYMAFIQLVYWLIGTL